MPDKLTHIDEKIQQLKKKRQRLEIQQALLFIREIQKIFNEIPKAGARIGFSTEIALTVFTNCWSTASDKQKKEWQMQAVNFQSSSSSSRQKTHSSESKPAED